MFSLFPAFFKKCAISAFTRFSSFFVFHELQDKFGCWSSEENLVANWKPSKAEVFIYHDELSIDPLGVKKAFCCYLASTVEPLKVLASPLSRCIVSKFDWF
mmetsp:Transcript_30595/g.88677  ORF Transcript_30595/g.88677 Transcript_30595/m.88677 type:complete len:101 (-) Transcript_30595:826-1128(-)